MAQSLHLFQVFPLEKEQIVPMLLNLEWPVMNCRFSAFARTVARGWSVDEELVIDADPPDPKPPSPPARPTPPAPIAT